MRLSIQAIEEADKLRAPGFAAAVREAGTVVGGNVEISKDAFDRCMKLYPRPKLDRKFPPIAAQAGNFVRFAGQTVGRVGGNVVHAATGIGEHKPILVPDAVKADRKGICEGGCPNFLDGRCRLCACGLTKWLKKIAWAGQACPDQPPRWGAWSGDSGGVQ